LGDELRRFGFPGPEPAEIAEGPQKLTTSWGGGRTVFSFTIDPIMTMLFHRNRHGAYHATSPFTYVDESMCLHGDHEFPPKTARDRYSRIIEEIIGNKKAAVLPEPV
jgi:hypothetical protein